MARVTISYRRDDSMDITGRIFDRLTSRYGREAVFRDIDNIPPGLDFREHIRASIEDSDVLMVVVGPRWLGGERHGQPRVHSETDYVRIEVEAALMRHIPVIPLLVGGADMPEPSELPDSIREFAYRNAVHVDSGRDFDHHMNGLIRATDEILAPRPGLSGAAAVAPASGKAMPQPTVPTPPASLLVPIVGSVMTVIGLMHIVWFGANLLTAVSTGAVQQMFQKIWTYADMSFGFGGLVVGIGTICRAHWARVSGVILCLLIASGNFLWFVDSFDQNLPRLMWVGTGLASLMAVVGVYVLLFRWPAAVE
jgi:hypothetical protein